MLAPSSAPEKRVAFRVCDEYKGVERKLAARERPVSLCGVNAYVL